jgi:ADP-ribose pyrophosphatase YjhB (NUDIX family)
MRRVALVVAKRDGLVLFGKRSDNGRWTLPGGHLNEGEDPAPARGASLEETSLAPEGELKLIDERETENGLKLYTYECTVTGAPTGKNDPDNECQLWAFLDVEDGIPKAVGENMQGPKNPDDNVAASVLGLAKAELTKMAPTRINQLEIDGIQNPEAPKQETPQHTTTLGAKTAPEDFDGQPTRVHNRFIGTRATEATSKIGTKKQLMAERQAFDYSHKLPPEHRAAGYKITVYHHPVKTHPPLVELTHNGVQAGVARHENGTMGEHVYEGHYPLRNKWYLNDAAQEHEHNARRTVRQSIAGGAIGDVPYLSTLPLPPVGERGQLLEVDKPRRGKKAPPAAEPGALTAGLGQAIDVAPDAAPLEVPPHKEMDGDERHHLWDYSHLLSPEDRSAGLSMEMRHTPGRFDNYMNLQIRDRAGKRYLNGFSYPNGQPGISFGQVHGSSLPPMDSVKLGDLSQAMQQAFAHHKKLLTNGQLEQAITPQDSRFAGLELSEKTWLAKREHDDEIDRLLMHPNPSERSMALKLHGVHDKHLIRAMADEDPEIQRLGFQHKNLGHHGLLALMQMPNREHLQMLGLDHPVAGRAHVEALYHTHKDRPVADKAQIMQAISHSAHLDAPMIEQMFKDGNGDSVVENLHTPPHVIEQLIEQHHLAPSDPKKKALARRALKHPHAPAHLVEHSFKNGPMDVKIAIAQSQHLPEALAQDVLQRGHLPAGDSEALLRTFIVQNQAASKRHLETGAKDRNPIVVHEARSRLGRFQKFEKGLNAFLEQGMKKAVRAGRFQGRSQRSRRRRPRLGRPQARPGRAPGPAQPRRRRLQAGHPGQRPARQARGRERQQQPQP